MRHRDCPLVQVSVVPWASMAKVVLLSLPITKTQFTTLCFSHTWKGCLLSNGEPEQVIARRININRLCLI